MKKIIYSLAVGALALMLPACDNNESPAEWTPAEKSDSPGLYFTTEDNILTVTAGNDTHVSIPVNRLEYDKELTVPLVVTTDNDKLIYPESVTFKAGEEQTDIVLDLANLPTKQLIAVTLTFPDEYLNPYAAGSAKFEGGVIVSDWEEVPGGPVKFTWYDYGYEAVSTFDPIYQTMMQLPGTNRYRILDFLNTGYDFTFEIQPSEYEAWKGYYRIMPLGNQVMYSEYDKSWYYNSWWLTDETKQEWPTPEFMSNGQPVTVYAISFLWYDDEYQNEFCYFRPAGSVDANGNVAEKNSGCFSFFGYYDESWTDFIAYLRLCFEFPAE